MATATVEKNTQTYNSFNPVDFLTETSLSNLSTLCWAQEQGEKIVRSWMDHNRVTREEGQKIAARFAEQARENQRYLQNLVASTVRMSLEAYRIPQQKAVEEMTLRLDELTKQVQKLTSK